MTYRWTTDARTTRQHWLYSAPPHTVSKAVGLVYELNPESFSVYGEDSEKNPYARVFLGIMPTLDEAKDLLVTITASQKI